MRANSITVYSIGGDVEFSCMDDDEFDVPARW